MFNEILTGKATLEAPPVADPYRQESVPEVSVTCVSCGQPFTTKVGSGALRCSVCHVRMLELERAQNGAASMRAAAALERSGWNRQLVFSALVIVCVVGIIFLKVKFNSWMREGRAEPEQTYSWRYRAASDDAYAYEVNGYASEMCRCSDLTCARNTLARFDHWIRTATNVPTDDAALDVVSKETDRFRACYGKLEGEANAR